MAALMARMLRMMALMRMLLMMMMMVMTFCRCHSGCDLVFTGCILWMCCCR